ncbi:MAG: phosphoenolpyruvate--protein phosphotransferase [Thermodesulfobacteriota bacterium]
MTGPVFLSTFLGAGDATKITKGESRQIVTMMNRTSNGAKKAGNGMKADDSDNRISLLYNIIDLADLLTGSADIQGFLQRTVELVSGHLAAQVCSIYLYDEQKEALVLKATIGLNPDAVGKISLKPGEGLVGTALETGNPVNEGDAGQNPRFKYFSEAGEDRFASLLAIPIRHGSDPVGVLVVQHEDRNFFSETDVMTLRALAAQLVGAIENAKVLMGHAPDGKRKPGGCEPEALRFIKAEIGATGYAQAPVKILNRGRDLLMGVEEDDRDDTLKLADFHRAVRTTGDQLKALQNRFAARLPESASLIFSAHFMILKDPKFIGSMIQLIQDGVSPPKAVRDMAMKYIHIFSSSSHAYIREKVNDVEDLSRRLLTNLYRADLKESIIGEKRIVIAAELYPSDILKLASEEVRGIILVGGSVTSHVTILSRSLQIPMLIADCPELLRLPEDTPLIMDAEIGSIYVDPSEEIIQRFQIRNEARRKAEPFNLRMAPTTHTRDGVRVQLLCNINLLSELSVARDLKAEGIGLYRTEFPFLIRSMFPSEEEQVGIYKRLIEEMGDREIILRTLDVGGDKVLSYYDTTGENNPQLGLRSVRFSLKHPEIFQQQIRAILRAAAGRKSIRIMFPMISSLDDFCAAREVVRDCLDDLARRQILHHPDPSLGMMIEVPSVVELIEEFAGMVDFFSIGTNDFVQYMLAADRTNTRVSEYYQPWHPSVLRGLSRIVQAVKKTGKDISVCGEVARDLDYIPFLLGIGIRRLSIDPQFLPSVQQWIVELSMAEAEDFAAAVLARSTIKEVLEIVAAG